MSKIVINTLEEFSDFIHKYMPMTRSLIHGQACDNEELGNMSSKDAWQAACDDFVESCIEGDEVKVNLDNKICSDWLWNHAS